MSGHASSPIPPPALPPHASTDHRAMTGFVRQRLLEWTPSLAPLAERLATAACHDVTVLMVGETGTGKTYLARLIHECSPRRNEPFVVVPCGAIPAALVESTFFGHVKGAFTGADRSIAGKLAAAQNGTILLDEIDALGIDEQVKLLRVMETGEYEPVGSTITRRCAARFIVTSNIDLEEQVARGRFRWDLFYRIQVMTFSLPPLRDRRQDIAPLARGMIGRFAEKFHRETPTIQPQALAALEAFPWPGNIRQLENALQQSVLLCQGRELCFEHLAEPIQEHVLPPPLRPGNLVESLATNREVQERSVIQETLATVGFRRNAAASRLGVSRVTLYRKMKKYGLLPDRFGKD